MTDAQKVSHSMGRCSSCSHTQTTESRPASRKDSVNITRPCLPKTPDSRPQNEYAIV